LVFFRMQLLITLIQFTFPFPTVYPEIVVCSRLWSLYDLLCHR
jgi:hypothetical protein